MSEATWIVLMAIASGALGRLAKMWPAMPKGLLPWVVIVVGYGIAFALAWNGDGSMVDEAAAAWTGIVSGIVAVGGHEALKPLLMKVAGEKAALWLLGKLPKPPAPEPKA